MSKLEKALIVLRELETGASAKSPIVDGRIQIIVTLLYLCVMLCVPLGKLSTLIWLELIPLICAFRLELNFSKIFIRSLLVLPVVILIGCFNPILEKTPAFQVNGFIVSIGWLSFISIIIRGLLAVQSILILIESCGFSGLCRSLHRLRVPSFLTDQLLFVYRYLSVLILEALAMRRAREARGYGKKSYPIKLWSIMIGQLFLRAIDRSERINRCMLSRGFNGTIPSLYQSDQRISAVGWCYLIIMVTLIFILRFIDISALFKGI